MAGRAGALIVLVGTILLAVDARRGAGQMPPQVIDREYEIKAAYLYNFGLYVTWPQGAVPNDQDQFVIGVLGKDPFDANLDRLAAVKKVGGRKIVVHRFKSMADYKPCHILFISGADAAKGSADERLAEAVRKLKNLPVLLVSDTEGHAGKGAIISLLIDENRVKFEVNPAVAKQAGLQISSKLLQLGKIVSKT
jgi:hypothetical protein